MGGIRTLRKSGRGANIVAKGTGIAGLAGALAEEFAWDVRCICDGTAVSRVWRVVARLVSALVIQGRELAVEEEEVVTMVGGDKGRETVRRTRGASGHHLGGAGASGSRGDAEAPAAHVAELGHGRGGGGCSPRLGIECRAGGDHDERRLAAKDEGGERMIRGRSN